jgi:hypothetical protein
LGSGFGEAAVLTYQVLYLDNASGARIHAFIRQNITRCVPSVVFEQQTRSSEVIFLLLKPTPVL